jgi:large subunit ribosomal protein L5
MAKKSPAGQAPGKGKSKGKPAEAKPKAAKGSKKPEVPGPPPRLREHYRGEVVETLTKRFEYKNTNQVPKLEKIVLNMGAGDALQNIKFLDAAAADLSTIAGQRASIRRAKKSIASFKLREGNPVGAAVTLRGIKMYEFMDRMISVAIPRVRDFRGLSNKGFDGRGNYNFGIKEHIIFPEIRYDKVEKIRGLNITIVTTAHTDEEGRELLLQMRMPFRKQ